MRVDHRNIRIISDEISPKVAAIWQSLPLVYISKEQFIEVWDKRPSALDASNADVEYFYEDDMPFDDFILMVREVNILNLPERWFGIRNYTIYYRITINGNNWTIWIIGANQNVGSIVPVEINMDKIENPAVIYYDKAIYPKNTGYHFDHDNVTSAARNTAAVAAIFFNWVAKHQLYKTIVTEPTTFAQKKAQNKRKVLKQKPWLRQSSHIIYLNVHNIPKEHQGGSHATPIGHKRRKHKRTLRHPKFKNNPLYQVEGGIKVRETWVGDTTWKDSLGNTYVVITEDGENE